MEKDESNQAYRILVIDDNVSIHEDFCKILSKPAAPAGDLLEMEADLFGLVDFIECRARRRRGRQDHCGNPRFSGYHRA